MCFNKKNLQNVLVIVGIIVGIVGLLGVTAFWYKYGFHIEDPTIKLNQFICLFGAFVGISLVFLERIEMKLDKLLEKP